jgi:tyrosine-protein phosphatase SIW14
MSINPYSSRALPVANQATAVTPQPPMPAPKESLIKRSEEEAADFLDLLGKVPFLQKLGVKLYGLVLGHPKANAAPLSNLGTLDTNVIRGAQPTEAGFAQLKAQGVNTIINLRPEEQWEKPIVEGLGMKYLFIPEPPIGPPTNQQGLAFLSAVTDPANGKSFFHCQHGADRTGAMAAIYRMTMQGWSVDQAIAEMPQYGFHQGIEDEKVTFVRQFASYWASLPPTTKAQVLHGHVGG